MYTITIRNEKGREVRLYTTTDLNYAYRELSCISNGDSTAVVKEVGSAALRVSYKLDDEEAAEKENIEKEK